MIIDQTIIDSHNSDSEKSHQDQLAYISDELGKKGIDLEGILDQISKFQITIPSWALGSGGTRFGKFPIGGEPGNLNEKLDDIGLLHKITGACDSISLHLPWDIPEDTSAAKEKATELGISFDSVNSNTFQDKDGQEHSYKFGSLSHTDSKVRDQAIRHNVEVIELGASLDADAITIWLADGSTFPGQQNFAGAFERTLKSLEQIYKTLPDNWKMFLEHKPFEPNFYSTVVNDWGSSLLLANKLGEKALCLVDLGHHLPNMNIEQVVSRLIMEGKLAGFHFNDSKYADDDLTVGSIKPYQLFLIFIELVEGIKDNSWSWMIDASHNVKDPLEDLIQSLEAIRNAFAQALLIDRNKLSGAQNSNDPVVAQEILQDAFKTDVRPLLREARLRSNAAIDPIAVYRELDIRNNLVKERGTQTIATGL
ncbi:MAG: sugar isomerase [Bacteroidetes bacterium]|nr:sugar isomerase [Bacteroidota bacterium]